MDAELQSESENDADVDLQDSMGSEENGAQILQEIDGDMEEDWEAEDEEVDDDEPHAWDDGNSSGASDWSGDEEEEGGELDEDGLDEAIITRRQRCLLECGVLRHDANFLVADAPQRHAAVASSSCHHQTADAITFLPRPGGSSSSSSSSSDSEEVVVSLDGRLSVYRLQAGKAALLLARNATSFKHYSIAASPCGNFVACSGSAGAVVMFRLLRQPHAYTAVAEAAAELQQEKLDFAAVAQATAQAEQHQHQLQGQQQQAPAAVDALTAKAVREAVLAAGGSPAAAEAAAASPLEPLAWQLEHVATLLCANRRREMMVNSVRFGKFAGQIRLLVSHQDGLLYLFNVPRLDDTSSSSSGGGGSSSHHGAAPAASAAAGSAVAAAASAAAGGAELMVRDLPDWGGLETDLNRRYVTLMMRYVTAAGPDSKPSQQQQQQQQDGQQQDADLLPGQHAQVAAAISNLRQLFDSPEQHDSTTSSNTAATEAAAGQARADAVAAAAAASVEVRGPDGGWSWPDSDDPAAGEPGSLDHFRSVVLEAYTLLRALVLLLESQSPAAASLKPAFASPLKVCLAWPECSFAELAGQVGQLLQDEPTLRHLQWLLELVMHRGAREVRATFYPALDSSCRTQLQAWTKVVAALRSVAGGQQALLGHRGRRLQWRQWQRQQAWHQQQQDLAGLSGSGLLRESVGRAAFVLLVLRLLEPVTTPSIVSDARVVVFRFGPNVDSLQRFQPHEAPTAPRLTTCGIQDIAMDGAALAAVAEAEAQAAEAEKLAAGPQAGPDDAQLAAEAAQNVVSARDAVRMLPLNICEGSPDGRWLAVGVDQTAVMLLPAAAGYQHERCHVLDICTVLPPHQALWQPQGQLGVQYLAFNSSSTLLAASSDLLRLVTVFEVATGRLLASFSLHNRPVLPVRFMASGSHLQQAGLLGEAGGAAAPGSAAGSVSCREGSAGEASCWGDKLLIYCEEEGGLHIVDLSTFFSAKQTTGPEATSDRFCIKTYIEIGPQPAAAPPAAAAAAGNEAAGEADEPGAGAAGEAAAAPDEAAVGGGGGGGSGAAAANGAAPAAAAGEAAAPVAAEAGAPAAAPVPVALGAQLQQLQMIALQLQQQLGAQQLEQLLQHHGGAQLEVPGHPRGQRINGLAVTPAGRLLLACQHELLEWRLLTSWSRQHHHRFPSAFKQAVRLLLMGAASTASAGAEADAADASAASSSSSRRGAAVLSQLPEPMLEQVFVEAAAPQVAWAAVTVPSYTELCKALVQRPSVAMMDVFELLGGGGQG